MPRRQLIGKDLSKEDLPPKVKQALEPLSVDERRFAVAFCECRGNRALAVVAAGIRKATDSFPNRASIGTRLARRPEVRSAINALLEQESLTGVEIVAAIKDTAEITPFPFYEVTTEGKLKLKQKLTQDEWERYAHWVKEIRTDEDGNVIELKMHDSYAAKRDLAKIKQLFTDAPVVNLQMYFSGMSDEQLMADLEEVHTSGVEAQQQKMLPAGDAS